MEVNRAYSFSVQRQRQLYFSALFALLCFSNLVDNFVFGGEDPVDTGIFALSLGGVLAAGLAAVGVQFHSKPLLAAYLVYIFVTLAFCVIYRVLRIGMHTGRYDFWFLVVSGVMVALVWAQLFWAMYFFDLLALYEAYHDHPSGFAENKIPIEDLEGVLASLGQKPKMSELAELLSALQSSREMNGEDATHFGFDDFCQLEALLKGMARRAALARRRALKQQARLQQQQRSGQRGHYHQEWGSRIDEFLHTDVLSGVVEPSSPVVAAVRRRDGDGRGESRALRGPSGRNNDATTPLLPSSASLGQERGGEARTQQGKQQRNVMRIAVTAEELLGVGGESEVVSGRGAGDWRGFAAQQQQQHGASLGEDESAGGSIGADS